MDYDKKWGRYRLRLSKNYIKKLSDLLLRILKLSYGVDPEAVGVGMKAKVSS